MESYMRNIHMSIDSRKVLTYAYLLKLVIFHHDIDVDTRIRLPEGLPALRAPVHMTYYVICKTERTTSRTEQLLQGSPVRNQAVVVLRQVFQRHVAIPSPGPQCLQDLNAVACHGHVGQVMAGSVIVAHLREVDPDDTGVVSLNNLKDPAGKRCDVSRTKGRPRSMTSSGVRILFALPKVSMATVTAVSLWSRFTFLSAMACAEGFRSFGTLSG